MTEENLRAYFDEMVADIEAFVEGQPIRVLNPEVLEGRSG